MPVKTICLHEPTFRSRVVKLPDFVAEKCDLHHFSVASKTGYGQCSYLRLVDAQGNVIVSCVFAKSRVYPVNYF